MRSVIGVLLLSSSALACIGGSSGGGGCCAPSAGAACAPSAPPCGGGSSYAGGAGGYPRPPISAPYSPGAGGSYASPPALPSFPAAPAFPSLSLPGAGASLGGSYQQAPLSLPSHGFAGSSLGGGYQQAPSAGLGGGSYSQGPSAGLGGGSYQQGPSAGIGGGSYQAAPVLSSSAQQGGSYQSAPSAGINGGNQFGGSYQSAPAAVQSIHETAQIGGGSYQAAPAAVVTETKEVITAPVVVAPAYGEKAVINNGPTTITKQTEVFTQGEAGYGAKEEEYEEVEQTKTAPAATYEKPAAVVQTTVIEKHDEKTVTGHEATEYEYEEEEKTPAPVAPVIAPEPVAAVTPAVVTVTDNYKAAAVQQNGQTEHAAGSEAAISAKEEPTVYSAEETPATPAGASYEAVEQDGETEQPKQVEASQYAQKAVETETTYDDEEAEKKEAEKKEEEKKEEYKRNTIKRNSANRA